MLLTRYSNVEHIFNKGVIDGIEFMNKMIEKSEEEKIFKMWVAQLPFMCKDTYVSFNEYKDSMLGTNIDRRSNDKILAEIEEIEKKLKRKEE